MNEVPAIDLRMKLRLNINGAILEADGEQHTVERAFKKFSELMRREAFREGWIARGDYENARVVTGEAAGEGKGETGGKERG